MAFRQKLVSDIRTFFKECKWEDMLHDQIIELLEMKPLFPYIYIQKKISLRSKLDNTKHSSFLTEVLIYCLFVNPLEVEREQFENKILFLCVEKYQHTKIRRNEAINIINALFMLSQTQEKEKAFFIKLINQELEVEHVNVCLFARLLFSTIIYLSMKQEIEQLDQKLSGIDLHINSDILHKYLESVNEDYSMMKRKKIDISSDSDLYKVISYAALDDKSG